MPRIEKIRLTGIKYDGMRKQYEDTILDFIHESDPQHTLLALMNGGGKGLLLQMLFQLLLPLTKWGPKSENRVEALFYNDQKKFIPYTFHVVMEWRLDTDPVKWLTTGIAITAQEKNISIDTQEAETETTETRYLLYTQELIKPSDLDLEALPLIEPNSKAPISLEALKEYLHKHRNAFTTYTYNQTKSYYELLQSYDINKKEWELMRDINRHEGGVEAFFKKGQDNHSLFHHLIIPEISRHLTSIDDEGNTRSLLDIFKNNAKIAQNLPRLLKREQAYELLLQWLKPIMDTMEQGVRQEQEQTKHRQEGSLIHAALREWKGEQEQERQKWQTELVSVENQLKQLRFQEDNLEFAAKWKDVQDIQVQIQAVAMKLEQAELHLVERTQEEQLKHASVLWNELSLQARELKSIQAQIHGLQQQSGEDELRIELVEIEGALQEQWNEVSMKWKQTLSAYAREHKQLEHRKLQKQAEDEKCIEDLHKVTGKLAVITNQLQEWNSKATQMEQQYGRKVNEQPDDLIKSQQKEWEQQKQKQKDWIQERGELRSKLDSVMAERQQLKLENQQLYKQRGLLEAEYETQRLVEEQMVRDLANHLHFRLEEDPFTGRHWFELKKQELWQLIQKGEKNLLETHQAFWTHQLDTALADHEYWIPNQEIQGLKEKLTAQGLQVIYGSELLMSLTKEQAMEQLEKTPLLPYGLVLTRKEWGKVAVSKLQSAVLRAPVPIYLRESMNHGQGHAVLDQGEIVLNDGSFILHDAGRRLVLDPEQWQARQQSLNKKSVELQENVMILQERLKESKALIESLNVMLNKTDAATLMNQLDKLKREMKHCSETEKVKLEQWNHLQQQVKDREEKLEEIRASIDQTVVSIAQLQAWSEACKQNKKHRSQKLALQTEEQELKTRRSSCRDQLTDYASQILILDRAHGTWLHKQQRLFQDLKIALKELSFDFTLDVKDVEMNVDSLYEHKASAWFAQDHTSTLEHSLRRWQQLNQTLEQQNIELAKLNVRLEHVNEKIHEKETQLEQVYSTWKQENFIELSIDMAVNEWNQAKLAKQKVDKELQALSMQLNANKTLETTWHKDVDRLSRRIMDKHGQAAQTWEDQDLSLLESEIQDELKKLLLLERDCSKLLSNLQQQINQLDSLISTISTHQIATDPVYEIPDSVRRSIKESAEHTVKQWLDQNKGHMEKEKTLRKEITEKKTPFLQSIHKQNWDTELQNSLQKALDETQWDQYSLTLELLKSIQEHAQHEMQTLLTDKEKAEHAREIWTNRASKRVISIINAMKMMTGRMTITNQGGHRFPLVKMDTKQGTLPEKETDVELPLREYFVYCIDDFMKQYDSIESIPDAILEERMNDSKIVLISLRNRYPVLHIYKPQTTNIFYYEKPRRHHYTEWETLNKGSFTEAKGSGGQLLAARTLIMMMLMTFKRQQRDTKQWSILISDNPFGQAVSVHILDPIFAIADVLNFQWIVLAPPELIKMDVSRRFPVFWELELKRLSKGETIIEQLQHGGRTFEDQGRLF